MNSEPIGKGALVIADVTTTWVGRGKGHDEKRCFSFLTRNDGGTVSPSKNKELRRGQDSEIPFVGR